MKKREELINKIKGLLNIANDKKSDEESKSALLLAQRLMSKYDIEEKEVHEQSNNGMFGLEVYHFKRENRSVNRLASVISKNFGVLKVMNVENDGKSYAFIGNQVDVELAEMVFNTTLRYLNTSTNNKVLTLITKKVAVEEIENAQTY